MTTPGDELHDIADPRPLLPGIEVPLWFWICLGAVAAAALAALWLFLRRRGRSASPAAPSCLEESLRALARLRETLPRRTVAEVATEASFIVRHYLAAVLREPALYETHEEFLLRADALEALPAGARDHLAPLLARLAACKYDRSQPSAEAVAQLVQSCLETLPGLDSTIARPVA